MELSVARLENGSHLCGRHTKMVKFLFETNKSNAIVFGDDDTFYSYDANRHLQKR